MLCASSPHCQPSSPSSTSLQSYIAMWYHTIIAITTVCNNYVLFNGSGRSAGKSNVLCCITTHFSWFSVAVRRAQTYISGASTAHQWVPLTFLGWDFMPISFWENRIFITHPHNGSMAENTNCFISLSFHCSKQLHLGLPMRNGSMA